MKKCLFLVAMVAGLESWGGVVTERDSMAADTMYRMTELVRLPALEVKDQYRAGTCWAWSTVSFLESEMLRTGRDSVDLSAMFAVKHAYSDKATKYVRMHGMMNFGVGGSSGDAMEVLEGLIREMPERPERLEAVKRTIRNWVNNEYPTNRLVSMKIASLRRDGYACDPNRDYLAAVEAMTMEDIRRFYTEHIKERTIAYAIVGSAKRIDMERLARFGQIVKITRKDIYK